MKYRNDKEAKAKQLVTLIRQEANLTKAESTYLSKRLSTKNYNFNNLPKGILDKLKESAKKQGLEYNGVTL